MEALLNMARRITEMRQGQILFTTMSENPALKKLVTYLNTEKQLQFGLRSDDTVLPNYSRTSIDVYGKPDAPIMLKDTGEFWRSFEVILDMDGFEIDGDSVKFDFEPVDLEAIYGEDIYGLTDKNMNIFLNALTPKIQKVIQRQIFKAT